MNRDLQILVFEWSSPFIEHYSVRDQRMHIILVLSLVQQGA